MTRNRFAGSLAPTDMPSRLCALYRERRAVRWTVELLVVLAVVLGISAFQARKHLRDVPLPALALRDLDGASVALDALRGKKTLVYLWAPWCGVCGVESSNVAHVQSLVGDRARVVSIVVGYDGIEEVQRYVREHDVHYPVPLGDAAVERTFRVTAFPTMYFVDAEGRITRSVSGYTTTAGLLARLFAP